MRAALVLSVFAIGLVTAAALIVYVSTRDTNQPRASYRETFERHNEALALLENERSAEAIEPLRTLAGELPEEIAPVQNLAVAGLTLLATADEVADPEAYAIAKQAASDGLEAMSKRNADRSIRLRLLGEYYALVGNWKKAFDAFTEAARDEETAADLWYEGYVAADQLDDTTEADRNLSRAVEADSRNLFLLAERLPREGRRIAALPEQQAAEEMNDLVTFTKAVLKPLRPLLKAQNDFDIDAALDEAAANPKDATRLLRKVAFAISYQPLAKSDRRDIDRNLLEFVATDFSSEFYVGLNEPDRDAIDLGRIEGVAIETIGSAPSGAAVATGDLDRDGRPELLVASEGELIVRGLSSDAAATQTLPLAVGSGPRLFVHDLDNDFDEPRPVNAVAGTAPCRTADLDVFVWSDRDARLIENTTDGLALVEDTAAPFARDDDILNRAAAAGDFDSDGDLDLAIFRDGELSIQLNRGSVDEPFLKSPLPVVTSGNLTQLLDLQAVDLDGDFDLDLVGLRPGPLPLGWFENLRHGLMRWRPIGTTLGPGRRGEAIAVLEADGDGVWDIALIAGEGSVLVRGSSPEPGRWQERTPTALGNLSGQPLVTDLNFDGLPELLVNAATRSGGQYGSPVLSLRDDLTDRLAEARALDPRVADATALAVVDPLGDGGRSLLLRTAREDNDTLQLLDVSSLAGDNQAVRVTLLAEQVKDDDGQPSGRVNAYGIGSTIQLLAGERRVTKRVTGVVTTLGIADREQADSLRVLWTNGVPTHVMQPAAGAYVCEEQKLKGSCPYAYAWDGQRFAFVTDLLWAAPIGLRAASGQLMQPREWEHLLVRGDQLKARDGMYELRITEELWEAAYFDAIRLTAVDHPPAVEIVTNEKVGPPELAAPLLHLIEQPAKLVAATVDGRDVLDELRAIDDRYARGWTTKRMQGVVEPATLDLAFEPVPPGPATLLLTGWMRPTDTSLNVGLAQRRLTPSAPSLHVPRPGGGTWQTIPFFGFPGGKTKTIAVDLGESFDRDRPAMTLASTMELSWDAIRLASRRTIPFEIGEREGVVQTDCELLSADLRERGVSEIGRHPHQGPERFDYDDVHPSPWQPMAGAFTRLGDVKPLLASSDDRLAVIGAGDEIAIRFSVPPLRDGLARDFVLTCEGYDKDADLNTVAGDSSQPYPLRGRFYPTTVPLAERTDAVWQTRRMSRSRW